MKPIVRIENLGKQYQLGARRGSYRTLRESLSDFVRAPFQNLRARNTKGTLWALKDVSFEVNPGEVVGIVGRNGAGKSTLLKILSRITEPTTGRVELYGRVGSLLEVGTGFHPELTGRENIYLNGAILGMRRSEIERKFDEIVDFAEIEDFLDTAVKYYSSGMYMRLAFSVAAHLEPEILVVDEVLAVGDAAFQKKCLGKMNDVANHGRTVLFVSHNMAAIQQLTRSCILLKSGALAFFGETEQAIQRYTQSVTEAAEAVYEVEHAPRRYPDLSRQVQFIRVEAAGRTGLLRANEPIRLKLAVRANRMVDKFRVSFTIFKADGTPVGSGFGPCIHSINVGDRTELELLIYDHQLAPGTYSFALALGKGNHREGHVDFDFIFDVCPFEIMSPEGDGGTKSVWPMAWGPLCFANCITRQVEQ